MIDTGNVTPIRPGVNILKVAMNRAELRDQFARSVDAARPLRPCTTNHGPLASILRDLLSAVAPRHPHAPASFHEARVEYSAMGGAVLTFVDPNDGQRYRLTLVSDEQPDLNEQRVIDAWRETSGSRT